MKHKLGKISLSLSVYPVVKLNFSRFFAIFGLFLSLVWLVGCQTVIGSPGITVQGKTVKVVRILSGQTIEVLNTTGSHPLAERVRLLGITAPDWKEQAAWSAEAKQQLATWIEVGKTVQLESDVQSQVDNNGSKLRLSYVWLDRQLINEKLVAGGYVLAYSRSPNTKYEQRLAYAQEQARLMGLGIWNPQNPMRQDPGEFDKR